MPRSAASNVYVDQNKSEEQNTDLNPRKSNNFREN